MELLQKKQKPLLTLILEWFRGKAHLVKNDEFTHYKGLGNVLDSYETGDYLIGVAKDGFKTKGNILATYLIKEASTDQVKLELIGYHKAI